MVDYEKTVHHEGILLVDGDNFMKIIIVATRTNDPQEGTFIFII